MPWPRIRAAVAGERRPPPVLRPQLPDQVAPASDLPVPGHPDLASSSGRHTDDPTVVVPLPLNHPPSAAPGIHGDDQLGGPGRVGGAASRHGVHPDSGV